jgi:hypothetical protein
MEDTFWRLWRTFFPAHLDRFLRFQWVTIFVISIGVFDLIFKLAVKLPPNMVHQVQRPEGLIKAPLFLLGYNAFLVAGFLAIFLTRTKVRYYSVRVIVFGMLFAGLIGQLLVVLVPWRS